MKVAVITPIPTPYRDAFLNQFGRLEEVDLHVFYCAKGKADRPWKDRWEKNFHHHVLRGLNLLAWKSKDASHYLNLEILQQLRSVQPDIILIGGYNHLTMWLAMLWGYWNKIPFALMSETREHVDHSGITQKLKSRLMHWIAEHSCGALPTGKRAEMYLMDFGWKKSSLFHLPNVPDVHAFREAICKASEQSLSVRKEYGLCDSKIILFVGRLIKKKRVDHLLITFAACKSHQHAAKLVIIGDGDQLPYLKQLSRDLNISNDVVFAGFREPMEILTYYSLAHVFVICSKETWGVALIEAALANLFLVCHVDVGVSSEMIERYPNVKVLNNLNVSDWVEALTTCLSIPKQPKSTEASFDDWKSDNLSRGLYQFLQTRLTS